MKNKNIPDEKRVKAYALRLMHRTDFLLSPYRFQSPKKFFHLDMRYNFDKAVFYYITRNPLTEEQKAAVIAKKKQRAKNRREEFTNVLSLPLVRDYRAHKKELRRITDKFLCFNNGRNHWAKNSFDSNVLAILKKYFYNL